MSLDIFSKAGAVVFVATLLSACHSSSSSTSTTTTVTATPTPTPTATTFVMGTGSICSEISGCVGNGDGFQFPDGTGGTVVCASGKCTDTVAIGSSLPSLTSEEVTAVDAYSDGYSNGNNDGYNTGYAAGDTAGYNTGYNDGYNDGYNKGYDAGYYGDSVETSGTKDPDLQKAQLEQATLANRAKAISAQFGMSLQAATQMTQLASKVEQMTVQGQMTAEDRAAITQSALGIAGVTTDEVNAAIVGSLKGDDTAADNLLDKAAQNLGMSNAAGLRDKLLPALGVQM